MLCALQQHTQSGPPPPAASAETASSDTVAAQQRLSATPAPPTSRVATPKVPQITPSQETAKAPAGAGKKKRKRVSFCVLVVSPTEFLNSLDFRDLSGTTSTGYSLGVCDVLCKLLDCVPTLQVCNVSERRMQLQVGLDL